ncbi:MAG: hypothetical protein ACP5O0_04295 [Acidimicrobiales bacterium]
MHFSRTLTFIATIGLAATLAGCGVTTSKTTVNPAPLTFAQAPSSAPTTTTGVTSTTQSTSSTPEWIIAASGLERIETAGGGAIAKEVLDNSGTTVLVGSQPPAFLQGWNARTAIDVKSLPQLSQRLSSPLNGVSSVLYDPEDWQFTPVSEQTNLAASVQQAATLAHQHNLSLIVAPALDLTKRLAPGTIATSSYLNLNLPAAAATASDALEIQAQEIENDTTRYAAFVDAAVALAKAANPNVKVYAGLSTNPSGKYVTAAELFADIQATRSQVAGYWINVPAGGATCPSCGSAQPQVAIQLFTLVAQAN